MQIIEPRNVKLTTRTEIDVRRNLPHSRLRRIGAWVFLDHFGPTPQVEGMQVAAHPHTGLQTVTWPFSGRVDHRDSIGSAQILEPGQLNLMTAGRGIAHSEKSLAGADSLHAAQLWLALPQSAREMEPTFEHHETLPVKEFHDGSSMTVFIGEHFGAKSPATIYSELVGAEIRVAENLKLKLNENWEHGFLVISGDIEIDSTPVPVNSLAYLDAGATSVSLKGSGTVLMVGGAKFEEEVFMWWNFIARSHEEVVQMREEWNARSDRFGDVIDDLGGWIPAPELPNVTLKAR